MLSELLLVINMQNDFINGKMEVPEAHKILPKIIKKLDTTKKDIIFVMDTHDVNYLNTQEGKLYPTEHCLKSSEGWHIIPELQPFIPKVKYLVEKTTFGCAALISLAQEYDTLELLGVTSEVDVITNALLLKTFFPEKSIYVDKRCCAGTTKSLHNAAMKVMNECQVQVI